VPGNVWAGGAAARQKQMEQMKQQQIMAQKKAMIEAQKKAYKKAMQKKMMEYLAAKKAAAQKRAYEEAMYKKMYQKKMAEKIMYEKAVKKAMQRKAAQAVVQKRMQQQALRQKKVQQEAAMLQKLTKLKKGRQQELIKEYMQRSREEQYQAYKERYSNVLQSRQRVQRTQRPPSPSDRKPQEKAKAGDKKNEEIVDIAQVWDRLEDNSEVWELMIDRKPKEVTVQRQIDQYKEQGVILKKSASYYVDRIDAILEQNPEMKQYPLRNILRVLAVMDYDFNNGENKDLMAMEVLGADLYLKNKKRPGLLEDIY
jgi:hypothetical protein